MSTELADTSTATYGAHFLASEGDWVGFTARRRKNDRVVTVHADMDRTDFLNAVAAECDVIVIPELPEVEDNLPEGLAVDTTYGRVGLQWPNEASADKARSFALAYFAIAERLDASQTLDEAQAEAEALEGLLDALEPDNGWHKTLAVRLVAAGVRVEVAE